MTGDPASLPEDKRERIIRAALAEFVARGYESASTNVITKQAGISKGLLFHYWGSKAGLYMYLVRYCIEYYTAWAARSFGPEQPSPDMVERIIMAGMRRVRFIQEEPLISQLVTQAFVDPPAELAPQLGSLAESYASTVNQELSSGIDTALLRPSVDVKRALEAVSIFSHGLRALMTRTLLNDLSSAEALMAETTKYLDLLKYGIYRQPPTDRALPEDDQARERGRPE